MSGNPVGIPVEDGQWQALVRSEQRAFWAVMVEQAGAGASVFEAPGGVMAAVIPATPERSVFNSVFYEDSWALLEALPQIGDAYGRAGVRAWTVWVPEEDTAAAAGLEAAGHKLDAEPRAMGALIGEMNLTVDLEDPGIELLRGGPMAEVARLNELAYDYPPGAFSPITGDPPAGAHVLFALRDGAPVACVVVWDCGSGCEVAWVATAPPERGRGLASALMAAGIRDAGERGIVTTTLQATAAGRPLYERLGYRDFGGLQMWERREP